MTLGSQEIVSDENCSVRPPELDFALVLSRVIGSIENDPAQLRNAVYELARIKLRQEAWQKSPPINLLEARRLTLALESAIDCVEAIHSKHDELRALQSLDRLIQSSEVGAGGVMLEPHTPLLIVNQAPVRPAGANHLPALPPANGTKWRYRPGTAPLLRAAMIALIAVAVGVVLDRQFGLIGREASSSAAPTIEKVGALQPKAIVQPPGQASQSPAPLVPRQSSPFPLPEVYGVYAVSGGRLHGLEPLPGRVLDQRVFMSTPIRTHSRTELPEGQVVFIVYRRDFASSPPDRITVRAIAKIMRSMAFSTAGEASLENVGDAWSIRNVSYEFRVAPLSEGSEMLVIRPENAEFVFPAGRYGLVIKGQAYDFTVAGPITEPAQCLEETKASNGTFYSECRSP
jgi:hypothetical protein